MKMLWCAVDCLRFAIVVTELAHTADSIMEFLMEFCFTSVSSHVFLCEEGQSGPVFSVGQN